MFCNFNSMLYLNIFVIIKIRHIFGHRLQHIFITKIIYYTFSENKETFNFKQFYD